jgi:hypothetical protein
MTTYLDDDDAGAECPVSCGQCGRIVDLHDCYHHPNCKRCWRREDGCDNLICKVCFHEIDKSPKQRRGGDGW